MRIGEKSLFMNNQTQKAVKALNKEGIIIFPTDTAFGIGCRIDSKKALKRLIKIRGRKENQPLPVLVRDLEMAKQYLKPIPKEVKSLIKKYWPGGLTIILPCKKNIVNPIIRGNGDTLGVRSPNHKATLELIQGVNIPIIGSSANFSGSKTPFSLGEVDPKLLSLVDFVLDGKCYKKESSTVIDCSQKPWKLLRQGAVKIQNFQEKIELIIDTSSNEYISVGLEIGNKMYLDKQKISFQKAQIVLPMIEKLLNEHDLSLRNLTSIKVNQGPGSFTGLRVGISITNALGHFLKIPINNKKLGELVEPVYKYMRALDLN
jgi:L-threonylcarbamoyladenylate synthase